MDARAREERPFRPDTFAMSPVETDPRTALGHGESLPAPILHDSCAEIVEILINPIRPESQRFQLQTHSAAFTGLEVYTRD